MFLTDKLFLMHILAFFLLSFIYPSKYCSETCSKLRFSTFNSSTLNDLDLQMLIYSSIIVLLLLTDVLFLMLTLVASLLVSYSHLNVFNIPKHVKITVFLHFEFLYLMTLTLTFTLKYFNPCDDCF